MRKEDKLVDSGLLQQIVCMSNNVCACLNWILGQSRCSSFRHYIVKELKAGKTIRLCTGGTSLDDCNPTKPGAWAILGCCWLAEQQTSTVRKWKAVRLWSASLIVPAQSPQVKKLLELKNLVSIETVESTGLAKRSRLPGRVRSHAKEATVCLATENHHMLYLIALVVKLFIQAENKIRIHGPSSHWWIHGCITLLSLCFCHLFTYTMGAAGSQRLQQTFGQSLWISQSRRWKKRCPTLNIN